MEAEAAAAAGTTLSLRRRNFQSTTCSVWRLTARGGDQSFPPFAIMHFLLPHHSVLESCARPRTCVPSFSLLANAPPLSIGKGSHLLKNLKDGIYAKWIHGAAYITPIHFTSSTLSTSGETDHQKRRDRPTGRRSVRLSVRYRRQSLGRRGGLEGSSARRLFRRRRWRTLEQKRERRAWSTMRQNNRRPFVHSLAFVVRSLLPSFPLSILSPDTATRRTRAFPRKFRGSATASIRGASRPCAETQSALSPSVAWR